MENKSNWQLISEYLPLASLLFALVAIVIGFLAWQREDQQQAVSNFDNLVTRSQFKASSAKLADLQQEMTKMEKSQAEQEEIWQNEQQQERRGNRQRFDQLEQQVQEFQLNAEQLVADQQQQLQLLQDSIDFLQSEVDKLKMAAQ